MVIPLDMDHSIVPVSVYATVWMKTTGYMKRDGVSVSPEDIVVHRVYPLSIFVGCLVVGRITHLLHSKHGRVYYPIVVVTTRAV